MNINNIIKKRLLSYMEICMDTFVDYYHKHVVFLLSYICSCSKQTGLQGPAR